jgi:NAD(P)H dehydrogenase (quinone)
MTATEAREGATTDPTVQRHIADLTAADILAVVHPNTWGAPPAIMKGWIDRVFAENAAYGFEKGTDQGDTPIGLLKIKSALVINTGNTPLDRERDHFLDPLDAIWRTCILGFCGVPHITRRLFGVVATSTDADRAAWLTETKTLATHCVTDAVTQ